MTCSRRLTNRCSTCSNRYRFQIEALKPDFRIPGLLTDAVSTRNLARVTLGLAEDLRSSLQLDTVSNISTGLESILSFGEALEKQVPLPSGLESIQSFGEALEKQFRLPTIAEIPNLLPGLEMDAPASALTHYQNHATEIRHAIGAMTTPWLNTEDQDRSFTGIVELQEIGHVLHTMPGFDIAAAAQLRPHLGDWRTPLDWPPEIFIDPLARSEFYVELGLNPALTEFPASAFDQATTLAGIKFPPPARIHDYDYVPEQDDEKIALDRTIAAYGQLHRFETQIREFIDQRMTSAVGENWIKSRVPEKTRKEWHKKKTKARDGGELERPLIAYADFTDYKQVIEQNNNWSQVFESIFQSKILVQESFQRLYPIRVCTMHSRPITQDDELYLHAETRRLLKAIQKAPS